MPVVLSNVSQSMLQNYFINQAKLKPTARKAEGKAKLYKFPAGTKVVNNFINVCYVASNENPYFVEYAPKYYMPISMGEMCGMFHLRSASPAQLDETLRKAGYDGITVSYNEIERRKPYVAIFVPTEFCFTLPNNINSVVNDPRLSKHGDGDYLLCQIINGQPDWGTLKVVNGVLFEHMFSTQSFHKETKQKIKREAEAILLSSRYDY